MTPKLHTKCLLHTGYEPGTMSAPEGMWGVTGKKCRCETITQTEKCDDTNEITHALHYDCEGLAVDRSLLGRQTERWGSQIDN